MTLSARTVHVSAPEDQRARAEADAAERPPALFEVTRRAG